MQRIKIHPVNNVGLLHTNQATSAASASMVEVFIFPTKPAPLPRVVKEGRHRNHRANCLPQDLTQTIAVIAPLES